MPWTYAFDPLTDTVFVTASGILSDRELVPGVANLMRDPNFHPGVRVFDDYSQVEELRLARPFVSPLHEQTESRRLRSRHALVIRNLPGADLADGMFDLREIFQQDPVGLDHHVNRVGQGASLEGDDTGSKVALFKRWNKFPS